jgi:hypothetical protein
MTKRFGKFLKNSAVITTVTSSTSSGCEGFTSRPGYVLYVFNSSGTFTYIG